MLPDHAASVFAVAARFGTKAGRVSSPLHRQLRRVENLFPIVISDRHFGSWDEIESALVFKLKEVLFELGQLAGAKQRVAIYDERRQGLLIPMFARVQVEHKINQSAA